jgi:ribosomal protein S18 acetylase RimI-like enzyme
MLHLSFLGNGGDRLSPSANKNTLLSVELRGCGIIFRMPASLRRALPTDAPLLADMGARLFRAQFGADNTPEDMDAHLAASFSLAKIAAELADPAATFLLLQHESSPAGYAKLYAGAPPACVTHLDAIELARLYVETARIGQGLGAALMRACLDEARQQGYAALWLGVWQENPRAIAFYRRWGFEAVGTQEFVLGSDVQTDWVMARLI